jgi:hypothetical protein
MCHEGKEHTHTPSILKKHAHAFLVFFSLNTKYAIMRYFDSDTWALSRLDGFVSTFVNVSSNVIVCELQMTDITRSEEGTVKRL